MPSTSQQRPAGDGFDEFAFLAEQASAQGRPAPSARRLSLVLPDGRSLSGIRYEPRSDDDDDERPAIVLLHGAGLNAHTWDNTVIALGRSALAVDLPGHGESSWRDDADYAPRTIAPDVVAAIEAWASAPVVLVGQSLGGLTAAAVAAAVPDLVAATVVVDILPAAERGAVPSELLRFYEQTDFESVDALVERALAFGLGGSPEQARRGVLLNARVRDDGRVEWKHHIARLLSPSGPGAVASYPAADGWQDLSAMRSPLTLVRASAGHVSEAAAADFARRIDDAEVVAVDAPHNVQEVAFGELAALISSKGNASA